MNFPTLIVSTLRGVEIIRWDFDGGPLVIGRSGGSLRLGLEFEDPTVSRVHAQFECRGRNVWLHDCGSLTGTLLDGETVKDVPRPVDSNVKLEIGNQELILHVERVDDVSIYDVFLCHNSKEKPQVREIANELAKRGLRPWFDETDISIGSLFIDVLSKALNSIEAALVCVGSNDTGPWSRLEIQIFLKRLVEKNVILIPVLLEGAISEPNWPEFIDLIHRVDFRNGEKEKLMNKIVQTLEKNTRLKLT